MKIKKLNVIMFLFLVLTMVGLSPPLENLNINNYKSSVYADNNQDSASGGVDKVRNDAEFVASVESYIAKYDLFKNNPSVGETLVDNLDSSIGRFNDYLDLIVDSSKVVMTSACILTIALIGFKYMNGGSGNLINFIKSKEKLQNTALAMIFVMGIPTLVSAVDSISVKVYNDGNNFSGYGDLDDGKYILTLDTEEGAQKISNIFVTPSSYLTKLYTEDFLNDNTSFDGTFASGDADDDDRFLSTGGFLKMIERFLLFLLKFIYLPFHFIINIIGLIGFYPMSFDPALYEGEIIKLIVSQMSGFTENELVTKMFSDTSTITTDIVTIVAEAFQSVIIVINLIAGILKKICLATVNFACYSFGLKVLLGVDSTKIKDFLYKLVQGVLGMFAAPMIVQSLIDIDAIISAAILGLAGNAVPGMGMMNLIMKPDEAAYSVLNFVFAAAMLAIMVFIVQAFFFRRIELIMYYLAAPAVFLKHIFEPRPRIVMQWLQRVYSACFVTTTYAPLFVTVNFLIQFGGALTGLKLLLYYAIILFIIYKGKDITLWLTDLFFGGKSFSDTMMRTKLQDGLDYSKNIPGNLINSGSKIALAGVNGVGKVHGMISGVRDSFSAEKQSGGNVGSFMLKSAKGALISDGLKTISDSYAQGYSSSKEGSWYNKHLENKEARMENRQKAGLGLGSLEKRDMANQEVAARHNRLKDQKEDGKKRDVAYKEVVKDNPDMDRTSEEFKEAVRVKYENKGINNADKVNYAKGESTLEQLFEDNVDAYGMLEEDSLINETSKTNLIGQLLDANGIDKNNTKAKEEFMKEFKKTVAGQQLEAIEKAKKDFEKAKNQYEQEMNKPVEQRDVNTRLDALKVMDKAQDIIKQSSDVEKIIRTQASTAKSENELKTIEDEITKESRALAQTITEITTIQNQIAKADTDSDEYSNMVTQLAALENQKATHESNRDIKINTRANLEKKISNNNDTVRQQETIIKTKFDSIERTYSQAGNRSVSENAYRDTVGKTTYNKVRIETEYTALIDTDGKEIKDENGNTIKTEIKVKRDASGTIRKDSHGQKIDYSSVQGNNNYNNHLDEMKILNESMGIANSQISYAEKPKSTSSSNNNNSSSKDKQNGLDKIFKENLHEQILTGGFRGPGGPRGHGPGPRDGDI